MSYREEETTSNFPASSTLPFVPGQWALIHLENLWQENLQTAQGQLLHQRCHDAGQDESRGDLLILRDLRISSPSLGLSGACDVVEFHRDPKVFPCKGGTGCGCLIQWSTSGASPNPIRRMSFNSVPKPYVWKRCSAALFRKGPYFTENLVAVQTVTLDESLRQTVKEMAEQMHQYAQRGYTPKVKPKKGCSALLPQGSLPAGTLQKPLCRSMDRPTIGGGSMKKLLNTPIRPQ